VRLGRPSRLFPFPPGLLRALLVPLGRAGDLDRLTADLVVDASHLRERLGFEAPQTLEEGLDAWLGAAS
jgi:UDP-glucose 4-epimerase